VAGEYRIRFMGDLGNLSQFTSGIVGSASSIKSAFRASAASPVTNLKVPGLNISNLTTTVDAANRVLIQSGTVFHRTVVGWKTDLAALDAATTKSARAGGAAGYGGASFRTPTGPAVMGSGYGSTKGGKPPTAGVYAKDLKPVYETFATGEFSQIMGDFDKINAATQALIPASLALAAIDKKAALEFYKYEAGRITLINMQTAAIREQTVAKLALERAYKMGGGTVPKFNAAGVMTAPGKLIASDKEIAAIAKQPVYQAVRQANATIVPLAGGGTKRVLPTAEAMRGMVQADMALAAAGAPTGANLELAIRQARGIELIEKDIAARNIVLKEIDAKLTAANAKQEAFNKKVATQRKAIATQYAPEYTALNEAKTTPGVPYQMKALLERSKSLRKDVMKNLDITAPFGTTDFAKQFNEKVSSVQVSKDLTRGITNVSMEAQGADGIVGRMTTSLNQQGQTIEKWSGSLRNAGSTLKMVAVDFKKVLEWTVATTLVFGAFGAVIGSISKVNKVTNDLQRFQIVSKTTGEETKAAFDAVAEIAYKTATPLMELTAVMDDIALATRKVGQTTKEWAEDMKYLTNAVGIFTNIAGVDTVKATDQLSAAFKQLQIDPDQLTMILNKVTAVAGGNAQATQDIISAIGTVAEAAKAAGFDIDEQIAAVQVLSQVTNKSAADIATSFKNLFGSLNAPASVKVLKSFGIEVRDATGNLRPFLDVYKEIYDAIQQGVIPEGRVQDILRAISGGPRRAPDAAAILGNLPKIFETIAKSANATNEALIANAKILDTNTAKLQQMRTAFDTAIINAFTESVNKLVAGVTDLGKIFATVLGSNASSSVASSIIQFGILVGSLTLVTKLFGGMRTVLRGLATDLKLVGIQSKANSYLFGNATAIGKGAYKSPLNLTKTERPGFAKYVQPGGQFEYWPLVSGTTPPMPPAFKTPPRGLQGVSGLWQGNRAFRMGSAGLGGAAAGLALGGAGALTGNGAFSQVGTMIGAMGLMSMNPVVMGAGAATLAVSQLFQIWQDGIEKTKQKQKTLQASIYDQIKALQENQRAYETIIEIQENAKKTIDELSVKALLNTDETERLTEAQNNYATSTIDAMGAERSLLDSRGKLLAQLPQLEKYADLASKAMSLNPADLKMLAEKLAQDILISSGVYVPKPSPMYKPAYAEPQTLDEALLEPRRKKEAPILGRSDKADFYNYDLMPTKEVIEKLQTGGIEEVIKFLKLPHWTTGGKGVEVTPELANTISTLLSLTTEEERANIEGFADGVKIFESSVLTMQGVIDPYNQMVNNLAGFKATTEANLAFGIGDTKDNQNAELRQKLGQTFIEYARRVPETAGYMRGEGRSYGSSVGQRDINELMYGGNGKTGFVSNGEVANTGAMTADEAKMLFGVIAELDPALVNAQKNTAEYGEMVYQYFKKAGFEIDGLRDPARQLAEDFATLREEIDASVISGKQALYDELVTLQAQKQGGEFKKEPQLFTGQKEQVEALITAYTELGVAFNQNVAILPQLRDSLGSVKILQGLLLTDVNNLLPSLLGLADRMGLTGKAVDKLKDYIKALIGAVTILNAMPDTIIKIRVQMTTAIKSGSMFDVINAARDAASAIGAASAAQKTQASALAAIEKLFANAGGTSFGASTGGGGGGGTKAPIGSIDLPKEWKNQATPVKALVQQAVEWAKKYQAAIPGEDKEHKKDLVAVMMGNTRVLLQRGIAEEYLKKAIDALTDEMKKANDTADMVGRIRIGAGDFAAMANVPFNSKTGISVGGEGNAMAVNVNINGQILTPAQMDQLADHIAAALRPKLV